MGGCQGTWRDEVRLSIRDVMFIDPFRSGNQGSISEFVPQNYNDIAASDVCFFVINYPTYTGACAEIGYAHALGKPVILVFLLRDRLDPMVVGACHGVYTALEPAIEKLRRISE